MANYQILKADIDEKIYENAQQKITGENLNSVLNAMVATLGAEYQFAGVATIDTNPETSDAKVFYIANGKGTYTNFGGINVTEDDVVILYYDTSWHKVATGIASQAKVAELESRLGNSIDIASFSDSKFYDDGGTWRVGLPSYTGFVVPCKEGDKVRIKTNDANGALYSFVQNAPVQNAPIVYANGETRRNLSKGEHIVSAPTNTKFLWLAILSDGVNLTPSLVQLNGEFVSVKEQILSSVERGVALNNLGIKTMVDDIKPILPSLTGKILSMVDENSADTWKTWKSGISLKKGVEYALDVTLSSAQASTKYFYLTDGTNDSGTLYIRAHVTAGDTQGHGTFLATEDVEKLNIISFGTLPSTEIKFSSSTIENRVEKLEGDSLKITPTQYTESERIAARKNIGLEIVKDKSNIIVADGYVKRDGTFASANNWKRTDKILIDSIFDDDIVLSVGTNGDDGLNAAALAAYDEDGVFVGYIGGGFLHILKSELPVGTKQIAMSFYNKTSSTILNSNIVDGVQNLIKENGEINERIDSINNDVLTDLQIKKGKVEQLGYMRSTDDPKPLLFMHISDTHGSTPLGFVEQMQFAVSSLNALSVNRTNKNNNVKFLLHTGDIHRSNPKGEDSDYTYFENAVANAIKPVFVAVGNHDVGESDLVANSATNLEVYNQMIAPMLASWGLKTDGGGVPHPQNANYYFTDFTDEKIRLVVLYEFENDFEINPSDPTKLVGNRSIRSFSQAQIDWFINTLLTTPAGYGVIIAKHQPEATLGNTDNPFSSPYTKGQSGLWSAVDKKLICEIVDAFMNGTTISKSYAQTAGIVTTLNVSADFSQKNTGAEFICYCSGHLHCDSVNFIQEFPSQLELNIGVDNDFRNYTSGSDMMQLKSTKTENLINVYSIDRLRGQIHIVRIGADFSNSGQDRTHATINYK